MIHPIEKAREPNDGPVEKYLKTQTSSVIKGTESHQNNFILPSPVTQNRQSHFSHYRQNNRKNLLVKKQFTFQCVIHQGSSVLYQAFIWLLVKAI